MENAAIHPLSLIFTYPFNAKWVYLDTYPANIAHLIIFSFIFLIKINFSFK